MAGSRCAAANSNTRFRLRIRERVGDHENGVRHLAIHGPERLIEVVGLAHAQGLNADAQGMGTRLRRLVTQGHSEILGIPKHRHAVQVGRELLQKVQPLGRDFRGDIRDAGEIAARPGQALDQLGADRVACVDRHDRQGRSCLAARAAGYPLVTMISTLLAVRSARSCGRRSTRPSAPRRSNAIFFSGA